MKSTLDIVHMAFEQSASIINPDNRRSQAASCLLQYLDSTVKEVAVKQRIAKELAFVQAAVPSAVR
jgi:hypothetical protein